MPQQLAMPRLFPPPSLFRVLGVAAILLPLVVVAAVQFIAVSDLETWLTASTKGYSRPDAFAHLTRILPLFTCLLAVTSVVAVLLVLWHRPQCLIPLLAGPLLGLLAYLAAYGVSDPAWFSLLALLTIGMLVATPVTIVWAVATQLRRAQAKAQ